MALSAVSRSVSLIAIERDPLGIAGGVPVSLSTVKEIEKLLGVTWENGTVQDSVRDMEVGPETVNSSGDGENSVKKNKRVITTETLHIYDKNAEATPFSTPVLKARL